MVKRKLTEDITVSELLTLREDGHSNREIAKLLDVSYQTILKYIGPHKRKEVTCND